VGLNGPFVVPFVSCNDVCDIFVLRVDIESVDLKGGGSFLVPLVVVLVDVGRAELIRGVARSTVTQSGSSVTV
jgi:hypothetical protein